jgi:pyridoxal phosphate enzyme (YggS family)
MSSIRDNVLRVREQIDAALDRAGRAGDRVTVVGITKTWGPEMVDAVVEAGIEDIGENRVQEFLTKHHDVTKPCRWHLVGHLQRNKATKVIGQFHCVQSLDSVRLAETLSRLGGERGVRTRALLQVNTSKEVSKHGFSGDEAAERAAEIAELPHIDLEGLMTIGPVTMDPVETRSCFKQLCRLRDDVNRTLAKPLFELSMGMSGDFETAVEEGATIVRLGTVLTGARDAPAQR